MATNLPSNEPKGFTKLQPLKYLSFALTAVGTGICLIPLPGTSLIGGPLIAAGVGTNAVYIGANFGWETMASVYRIAKTYRQEKEPLFDFWLKEQEKQGNKISPWRTPLKYAKARIQTIYLPAVTEAMSDLMGNARTGLVEGSDALHGGVGTAVVVADKALTHVSNVPKFANIKNQLTTWAGDAVADPSFTAAEERLKALLKERGFDSFEDAVQAQQALMKKQTGQKVPYSEAKQALLTELAAQPAAPLKPSASPNALTHPEQPAELRSGPPPFTPQAMLQKAKGYTPEVTSEVQAKPTQAEPTLDTVQELKDRSKP